MWVRRDVDFSGQGIIRASNGAGASEAASFEMNANDTWQVAQEGGISPDSTDTFGTSAWAGIHVKYVSETSPGSSADGTLSARLLDTIAGGWVETESVGSLSDQTADNYVIGNGRPNLSDPYVDLTVAMFKVYTGTALTDNQVETELQYRNPQVSMWASHKFADGALATDDSGNTRTLTLNGSPSFTSDEPSDILGDDPGGGTPVAVVPTRRYYRERSSGLFLPEWLDRGRRLILPGWTPPLVPTA